MFGALTFRVRTFGHERRITILGRREKSKLHRGILHPRTLRLPPIKNFKNSLHYMLIPALQRRPTWSGKCAVLTIAIGQGLYSAILGCVIKKKTYNLKHCSGICTGTQSSEVPWIYFVRAFEPEHNLRTDSQ